MTAVPQDLVWADDLSFATNGRPIQIVNDYTIASDVTPLHLVDATADQLDTIWLKVWNNDVNRHDVVVSISPATTTGTTDIDAAVVKYQVPEKSWVWILAGERLRFTAATTWTVAAYADTSTATAKYLSVTGWILRTTQAAL